MGTMDPSAFIRDKAGALLLRVDADPRDDLALGTALRSEGLDVEVVTMVLQQRTLRRRAASRLRDVDQLLLTGPGLEQATATQVAQHRAGRFSGLGTVLEVCCGIGGDSRELVSEVTQIGRAHV